MARMRRLGESEEVLHRMGVRQRRVGRSTVGRERLYSVRMDKIYLVSGSLGRSGFGEPLFY